jgi:hypothetical protein
MSFCTISNDENLFLFLQAIMFIVWYLSIASMQLRWQNGAIGFDENVTWIMLPTWCIIGQLVVDYFHGANQQILLFGGRGLWVLRR